MAKHKPDCPNCNGTTFVHYNSYYDAYYCERCDLWLEPDLHDIAGCPYSGIRPEKPSDVK